MIKKIIVCADDYAQNESISYAIIDLIQAKRISAASCMTLANNWNKYGKILRNFSDNIDVGLHFDLTHFGKVNNFTVPQLILACYFNKIDLQEVEYKLNCQLDEFERVMGRAPDYIDGHQHIHILPGIRLCLLKILKYRYKKKLPYLRSVSPALGYRVTPVKIIVLRLLAKGFSSLAAEYGFATTKNFMGVYSFRPVQYDLLFKDWLRQVSSGSLIMCHPGYLSEDRLDPIRSMRIAEFNYLISDQYLKDLADNNIEICRFQTAWRNE